MRFDGRANTALRKVKITKDFMKFAEGSCLFEIGNTMVICTASIEKSVPPWLKGKGTGWVTAEYGMLPRSCKTRVIREASRGKLGGRTQEIQRLIGRSMRAVCDMAQLGERTIWMDSDVIQADGGTRCASISGSFVALILALEKLKKEGLFNKIPVSVGLFKGKEMLDLTYEEDSRAEVDMNIVMTKGERFIEVQGTAEGRPFTDLEMDKMISSAKKGINSIFKVQEDILGGLLDI